MTDAEGEEVAKEDTAAAPEAVASSQSNATERDYEAEARDMGWVPETEFKGDKRPKKFLSAEEFVERGETLIPILNKRLKDKDAEIETRVEARVGKMQKVFDKTVEQMTKLHERQLAEAKAAKKEAVKAGDVAEVERLDGVIDGLKTDAPESKEDATAEVQAKQKEWMKDNPWFEDDFDMTDHAIKYTQFIAAKNPERSFEDNMKLLAVEMEKKFPEKFGGKKTSGNGHALVDGGGAFNGPGAKNDPLAKLPAEARAQADIDMKKFPKIYFRSIFAD